MTIYNVWYFNETDWTSESVGYFSTKEKALQAIAECGIEDAEFHVQEIELDRPIAVE